MGHKTFGFSMYDVLVRILRFSNLLPVGILSTKDTALTFGPFLADVICGRGTLVLEYA